jgi:O-antigen/teichoic acid export membrane protein
MSVSRNYFYNTILTLTNILIPFITIPYITRVLDPEGLGTVIFTNSVVQYFVLFAALGMDLFATRELAAIRDNKSLLKTRFISIQITKTVTAFATYIVFVFFAFFYGGRYLKLYFIQSLAILNVIIDISYFFRAIEDFKKITIRNLFVRLIGVVLLFVFVRRPSDFYIYALITVGTTVLGNVVMWLLIPKDIINLKVHSKVSFKNYFKYNLTNSLKLFIPLVAIQIYVVLDKTMVGILSNESEVAFYDMSQRMVKLALSIVTAIGPVMIPKMSNLIHKGNEEWKIYVRKVLDFVTYSSILIIVILIITSKDFVPLFFGVKFLKVRELVVYIVPIILLISWSNLFGMQLFVPMKKESYLTLSVVSGALTNFTLNLLLIPRYQALGAVIATVIAEFSVTLVQIILARKIISLKTIFQGKWKHFISGLITFTVLLIISRIQINVIAKILLEITTGIIVYMLIELMLKTETSSYILEKVSRIFRKVF